MGFESRVKGTSFTQRYSLLRSLGDQKLLRRCLRTARQNAEDVLSKVVLSAWLRFDRREDELVGVSSMDCGGGGVHSWNVQDEEKDVSFCVGNEEINCVRWRIAALSEPFKAMLYGGFAESKMRKIDFTKNGICPRVLCEEMKSACEAYWLQMCGNVDDALVLVDYGLEERAPLLVASCLQVLLRELPNSLYIQKVISVFCSSEAKERFVHDGGSVLLKDGRRPLHFHQLGCVLLEKKEYEDAQHCFEAAAEAGHVYSLAGVARTKHKQGQPCSAYKLISSLIFEHKPAGWMYQERALYNMGNEKSVDLDVATELDPSLSFPYKYRALAKVEEEEIKAGILELDRIIGFKLSPDCLELRACCLIALEDYDSAMRDVRALLTLEPKLFNFTWQITGNTGYAP
ncbi:Tetratricopeptide-like helical domain superfamily [Sesbania bispinosa]|nr:Tetratricopeptide-like helical domain superfamily [Sesbania bispinosa]